MNYRIIIPPDGSSEDEVPLNGDFWTAYEVAVLAIRKGAKQIVINHSIDNMAREVSCEFEDIIYCALKDAYHVIN